MQIARATVKIRWIHLLIIASALLIALGAAAFSQERSSDSDDPPNVLRGSHSGTQINITPKDTTILRGSGPDPRELVDMNNLPWRAIGKVVAAAGALRTLCTGSLISPDQVLTAAHCLYNAPSHEYFAPSSTEFLLGYAGDKFIASAHAISFLIGPQFDPEDIEKARGSDWAVIKLETQVANKNGVLPFDPVVTKPGTPVMIGGYSYDRPLYVTADSQCEILAGLFDPSGEPLLFHDCTAKQGASGAPVLVFDHNRWTIRAVDVATARQNTRGLAVIPLRPGDQPFDPRQRPE